MQDFLEWLHNLVPTPPTVADLIVPTVDKVFPTRPSPNELLRFFSDFELVRAADLPSSSVPSPFMYGREPEWIDLDQHKDIERQDNTLVARAALEARDRAGNDMAEPIVVLGDAGTGKTTIARRVAHDLVRSGHTIFAVRTLSRIDADAAIACLSRLAAPAVLLVDNLADHIEQTVQILRDTKKNVIILGAERVYRREYLDLVLAELTYRVISARGLQLQEARQLVERYRQYGLVGNPAAVKDPERFSRNLKGDAAAVAICRILNDFRPLDRIVESLWQASTELDRRYYLCVALAQHCYHGGLRYSILQTIAGPAQSVNHLLDANTPLMLSSNAIDDDFVVPVNPVIAERVLYRARRQEPGALDSAFGEVATALAPHVNRRAIIRRSPEARLAGRLLDADKTVKPMLGPNAEAFYVAIQREWEWNSRYWEQRALLASDTNLDVALQYARHAVAIERHPFTLTTLGKLLFMSMERGDTPIQEPFGEAYQLLLQAVEMEAQRSRITVHPFSTIFAGASRYLEVGGVLSQEQRETLSELVRAARMRFSTDPLISRATQRLDSFLS